MERQIKKMLSFKTPLRFLEAVFIDLLSFPTIFMSEKDDALWHLACMCPLCSNWRKSFRDPKRGNECLWYNAWKKKKYGFSGFFGILNALKYYLGLKTDLEKYEKEYKQLTSS